MFQLYATGQHSLAEIRQIIKTESGKLWPKSHLQRMLKNPVYCGLFVWNDKTHQGKHTPLVSAPLFEQVQAVFRSHNRTQWRKHDFAFTGLLRCAFDDCMVTAEIQKQRYIYYHCTRYKGKCAMPFIREEELSQNLGQILQDIYIPDDALAQLQANLTEDQNRAQSAKKEQRERLQARLTSVRKRIDQAYMDKLEGTITAEFWQRMTADWQMEEQQVLLALQGLEQASADTFLTAKKTLELSNSLTVPIFYMLRRNQQNRQNC
jgi:site-specific DNA recombinase